MTIPHMAWRGNLAGLPPLVAFSEAAARDRQHRVDMRPLPVTLDFLG
jgi:hypothetical protein